MITLRFLSLSLRSQLQYRASFFLLVAGHFLSTFIDIFGIWVLFDRFKVIEGWTLPELCLIYGIIHMGFAIAESFARGFDTFNLMVKKGDFDRILLRPLSTLFQIAMQDVQFMRIGRFFQGFIVLIYGARQLDFTLFSSHVFLIFFSILGTASLFYGLFVIQGVISFWTVESVEVMNVVTYGGVVSCQYPISIYSKPFRMVFTFVIPLACVGYYPVAAMLQKGSPFGLIAPIFGFLFLFFSFQLWHLGVRRYRSTGS